MAKILALDFGTKRIGCAVSDESATVAFPRGVFANTPGEEIFEKIRVMVREERITKIVIGVPLDQDNEETESSKLARRFGSTLARSVMLPITYVDETSSTDEALAKIPFRKDRRAKGQRDAIAAQIILQRYLDS